jgi:hypothetical protein
MKESVPRRSRRDMARLERGLDQLHREVADLAADVRGLHDALDTVLSNREATENDGDHPRIENLLPPFVDEADPPAMRVLRRLKRLGLGVIRRLRTATDPSQEHLRWLEFVSDARAVEPVETTGALPEGFEEDLAFLFSRLPLAAAWSDGGGGLPTFRVVRGEADPFNAAETPGGITIGMDVNGGAWPDRQRTLAHRDHSMADGWCAGPWRVRAAPSVRRIPIPVRGAPTPDATPDGAVVVVLGEGLEGGLEQRVIPGVDALRSRDVPVRVVAAAAMSAAGEKRLAALSRLGAGVCRLERVIPPQLRGDRLRMLASGASRIWVIGGGAHLERVVEAVRAAAVTGARLVAEPGAAGVVIGHADRVLSPWPVASPQPTAADDVAASDEPVVVIAGDWVASARPEDAVFLARELAGQARIRLVGDGPRAGSVRDLAAVLGVSGSLDLQTADAGSSCVSPACVAWLGEGPWIPPAVAAAVAGGLPAVVPVAGVLPEFAEMFPGRVFVSGRPGDVGAVAAAIREALAAPDSAAVDLGRLEATVDAARTELLEVLAP